MVSTEKNMFKLLEGYRKDRLQSFIVWFIFLVLFFISFRHLNMPLERIFGGLLAIFDLFFNRMTPPDWAYVTRSLGSPLLESVVMAVIGTYIGMVITVPLAWCAASNLSPNRKILYPIARLILVLCRSVHEMIWAILFVAMFGFGPLPGTIVLTIGFIGATGKLFAENLESIDMGIVESMKAVGANRTKEMFFGVISQVKPVWIGITIYGWDIVWRASVALGLVGAGGLGVQLRASMESLRYQRVGAILVIMLVFVSLNEVISMKIRSRVM